MRWWQIGKRDADLDRELQSDLALEQEEQRERGVASEDAQYAALRAFGNPALIREQTHEAWGWVPFEQLLQDLRYALRQLRRSPAFSALAVTTLALGIGGNTAIFSIVNGVLLNPLPFPQPEQLVSLHESKPNFAEGSISYPNFLDWRKQNRSFSSMALSRSWSFTMTGRGDAEQLRGEYLSAGFFAVLGVHPLLGSEFTERDEQLHAQPAAIISEGVWRRNFNASPNILGQSIVLDGKDFTIVGVVPAAFRLQFPGFRERDVYVPIVQWDNPLLMKRGGGLGFHGIGRLKPNLNLDQARADMEQVTRNLADAFPDANRGIGATLKPLKEQMVGEARPFLLVLLGAVAFVLLIACVNVASLLLARAQNRGREFAVRAALGASRGRVVRQLLTESLLVAFAAGALGFGTALLCTHVAIKSLPSTLPRAEEIGIDLRVLAFTFFVSLATGILFGLAPALKTSRQDPQTELKNGGRTSTGIQHRTLSALVVVEMAIALVLLAGAGLMIRSLERLWKVDPGFNARGVLDFGLSLPSSINNATPAQIRAKLRELDRTFASVPGITAVSQAWGAIPMGTEDDMVFWRDDQPKPADDQHMSWTLDYIVGPGYLRVMQLPVLRGRFFTPQDDEHSTLVAVVDDVFARKFFPGQDPIGKSIDVTNPTRKLVIVGVVGHVRQWGLDSDDAQPLRAQLYIPCMQMSDTYIVSSPTYTNMIVRYDGDPSAALAGIRRTSKDMSENQVIWGEQTVESMISDSIASRRFVMVLLAAFAALALLMACIGIYGVMAYVVSQRTREIGIRMALGGQRKDMLILVLKHGGRLAVLGIMLGLGSAVSLTRLMKSLLFHISATDPAVLGGVSIVLALVAVAACMLPARRAASIDPMRALRIE
jgi:putative ABC transport system permease protein